MIPEGIAGKRVLVTAGGSGIGEVIVQRFVEADAGVHSCDVAEDKLESWDVRHPGAGITPADVGIPDEVDRLFDDALTRLGGLDILVNNAGVAGQDAYLEKLDNELWCRTLDV